MSSHTDSFRWIFERDYDVDAFLLESGEWFLFAYLKREVGGSFFSDLTTRFAQECGPVFGVGSSLKGDGASVPKGFIPISSASQEATQDAVWILESGLRYKVEIQGVLNPGLFLDQKANRETLRRKIAILEKNVSQLRLLNLFSYTGAFSVAASAAAKNIETTSVDVSARYLSWEKENLAKNREQGLIASGVHKCIRDDARDFLRRAAKKTEKYHFIILDPPTFSKGQGKAFQVQKEFGPMLEEATHCLAEQGSILASLNDARLSARDFEQAMHRFADENDFVVESGSLSADFRNMSDYPMKAVWLNRQP